MTINDIMDLDTFKLIVRSIAESENLEAMGNRSTQLLVGSLGIKASAIFALNPETEEIETLASFGLSIDYLNKGPIKIAKSKGWTSEKEPVVINDITKTELLQYPEQTKREGIMAMISIPIIFFGRVIGLLRMYHHETWDISKEDLRHILCPGRNHRHGDDVLTDPKCVTIGKRFCKRSSFHMASAER